MTEKDLKEVYDALTVKEQNEVVREQRARRSICSRNNDTHLGTKPRVMNPMYIVDTGTYQNNAQQVASMRNAGLALATIRQQMLYGADLAAASPMTRVRYAERIEILEEAKRMSSEARSRRAHADEARRVRIEEEKLRQVNSNIIQKTAAENGENSAQGAS